MSSNLPPRSLNVRKCVEREATITGCIPVALLPRVGAVTSPKNTDIDVSLQFSRDEAGKWLLRSDVSGVVAVECQRCLQAVAMSVVEHSDLRIVMHDDEARSLRGEHDTLTLPEAEMDVFAFIEDEILLGLPIVCTHPEDECQIDASHLGGDQAVASGEASASSEAAVPNPFQALAALKSKE